MMSNSKRFLTLVEHTSLALLAFTLGACDANKLTGGTAVSSAGERMSTSSSATGRIAPGGPYNLRTGPGTNFGLAGSIPGGTQVTISCQTQGTTEKGPWGTTNVWDRLSTGAWITDAFVYTGTNGRVAPECNAPPPPSASSGLKIPLTGGLKWSVSRGIGKLCGGTSSHDAYGMSDCYAVDFTASGRGSVPILAAGAGTVEDVVWNLADPAAPTCKNGTAANRVTIKHSDGTRTQYWHLASNSVPSQFRTKGAVVKQGDRIGTMGITGCTTGLHLHFRLNTGSTSGTSTALKDVVVDGVRLQDFMGGKEYLSTNAR